MLIHLIDATEAEVAKNYKTIRNELEAYSPALAQKPEIVALNKCDSLTDEEIKKKITALKRISHKTPFVISAVAHQGTKELMRATLPFLD